MEGIEHNPVVFDLMSEMAFRSQKVKVEVSIRNTHGPWCVVNYGLLLLCPLTLYSRVLM
jgi:hypothetical protein